MTVFAVLVDSPYPWWYSDNSNGMGVRAVVLGLYTTAEAAAYVGLAVVTVKKHIYRVGDLKADYRFGGVLVFREDTLDEFKAQRRRVGRPRADAKNQFAPTP